MTISFSFSFSFSISFPPSTISCGFASITFILFSSMTEAESCLVLVLGHDSRVGV